MTLFDDAREIWLAGVAAVRADNLIAQTVSIEGRLLSIADNAFNLDDFDSVLIVGAGKAAAAMTMALERVFIGHLPVRGWVNVPEGTFDDEKASQSNVRIFPARPIGLNEPTEAAIAGTKQILKLVRTATDRDLCIVVLTGGGSALLTAPIDGVSLEEKVAVIRHLSGAGADIRELNTVRKQLSLVKGGGLKNACTAKCLITLVLSDVLGDPLDVIASGPTVEDRSTANDALSVLQCFDKHRELPASIYRSLQSNHTEASSGTSPHSHVVVLGNNATAVDAAGVAAESRGYSHAMTVATQHEGFASNVGAHLADMALSMLHDRDAGMKTPDCLISGGEPTVELAPIAIRGRGGRNTHLVLAAMLRLIELKVKCSIRDRIVILSGGTDGEDGPTDAAGAILSSDVWFATERLKLNPSDYFNRSDSYNFFKQTEGLLITGPTHTNVCDVRVVVVKQVSL